MSEELSIAKDETIENKIVPISSTETVLTSASETAADTTKDTPSGQPVVPETITEPANENSTADASVSSETAADQTAANKSAGSDSPGQSASATKSSRLGKASYAKYSDNDNDFDFDFDEEEEPKKRFFRFRSKDTDYSRDQLILSRIRDEDLMDYLKLEQERLEFLQQAKEVKEKRILTAFQLTISLAAIVAVTYLLKDNPTILISILYIVGIIAALNIWKNPRDKDKGKGKNR